MNTVRVICRQSRLSLLQAEIVKQKIVAAFPGTEVLITGRTSRGDRELDVPLSSLDGSDFFTQEIFEALKKGEADLAVHSMKDMSAAHFFSHNGFAVPTRDDVRDVVIFNADIIDKLQKGEVVHIGTSSPRREEMAINFMEKALPQTGNTPRITTGSIRGNVESRLQQLRDGNFDGTILATAGLNRLLSGPESAETRKLLAGTRMMILPLIECVPAPCQGAILVETDPANIAMVNILTGINDQRLWQNAFMEKQSGQAYGIGCLQRFGVTTIEVGKHQWTYAAGTNEKGEAFTEWTALPRIETQGLFSSTDHMRDFFSYEWITADCDINTPDVFIANYKVLGQSSVEDRLKGKRLWASGTKTWLELAKKGYWVTGSADALGFEQMIQAFSMPLVSLSLGDITILTHEDAASRWTGKGVNAVAVYRLIPGHDEKLVEAISHAGSVFWTSFSQYQHYGQYCKRDVTHISCAGETATLLRAAGIEPVIFPTIKAFQQWSRSTILQPNEG